MSTKFLSVNASLFILIFWTKIMCDCPIFLFQSVSTPYPLITQLSGNPIIGTSLSPGIFPQLNKLGSFYCLLDGLHLGSFGSLLCLLYGLEEKLCKTTIWQENGSLIKLCYYLLGCPFVLSNYLWHKYLSIFLFNMNLWKRSFKILDLKWVNIKSCLIFQAHLLKITNLL